MTVYYQDAAVEPEEGETVLDALLRSGFEVPYGCRAGACQSCMMQVAEESRSSLPPAAQAGLRENQKQLGYFLACSCKLSGDLRIQDSGDLNQKIPALLLEKKRVSQSVLLVRFQASLDYRAGQYINLWKDGLHTRSYSLASLPAVSGDSILELHIKLLENGEFSRWLNSRIEPGETVDISGPLGECFYTPAPEAPLLLLAMGTGLAPVYGILQDALRQGHTAPINLVVAARASGDLYLLEELRGLAESHPQLKLHFIAQDNEEGRLGVDEGDVYAYVKEMFPITSGHHVYLCGGENFVRKMKKQCFLAGANMKDIHADIFLAFAPSPPPHN